MHPAEEHAATIQRTAGVAHSQQAQAAVAVGAERQFTRQVEAAPQYCNECCEMKIDQVGHVTKSAITGALAHAGSER